MAVVSFNLLTDLQEFRAEIKADLRNFQQETKQNVRREIETAISGVNSRTDTLRAEIKADNQKLASRMDSLDDRMDKTDKLAAELNGRIDQVYQLLLPAKPEP